MGEFMKKFDIISFGEALIDFTDIGIGENGMRIFEQNPGGAPANVACACAKLGIKTAFMGKVGLDMHGDFLVKTFKEYGVDTSCIAKDEKAFTTLAFVSLSETGERSFSFSRHESADVNIETTDIDFDAIKNSTVFHFGSLSLTDEPSKSTCLECVKFARENGVLVSYDPNYRPLLWKSKDDACREMKYVLDMVDIIKISDEEIELICDTDDLDKAAAFLHAKGIKIVLITLGSKGAFISVNGESAVIPTKVSKVVDTTGAGDSFLGGFLYKILYDNDGKTELPFDKAKEYTAFANSVAGLCVTKRGAIPSMPSLDEVLNNL